MADDYMPKEGPNQSLAWLKKFNSGIRRLRDPSIPGPTIAPELRNVANDKRFRFDESEAAEASLELALAEQERLEVELQNAYEAYVEAEKEHLSAKKAAEIAKDAARKAAETAADKSRPLADTLGSHLDMSDRIRQELGIFGTYAPTEPPGELRPPTNFFVESRSAQKNLLRWEANGNGSGVVYSIEYGICDVLHGGTVAPPMEYKKVIDVRDKTMYEHVLPKSYLKGQLRYRLRATEGRNSSGWIEASL